MNDSMIYCTSTRNEMNDCIIYVQIDIVSTTNEMNDCNNICN